ncbi:MAG: hypothetical protein EAZ40_10240 [Rhodobacterales bacterium]|nr:MAG: hypothetical protein EAZ40_10240 [Rhodobacterales bacterium]
MEVMFVAPRDGFMKAGDSVAAGMADITVKAAYGSVVEDEGFLFIGFAEGEEEEEGYVLFRQPVGGGPVWFEVNDEAFGAEDAVAGVTVGPKGFEVALRPELAVAFGFATSVAVKIGPGCEDATPALEALREMLGEVWPG